MNGLFSLRGFLTIKDLVSNRVLFSGNNGINYENFTIALANSVSAGPLNASTSTGFFQNMVFGNGGTNVSSTGVITYNPPNIIGTSATLYNQTYSKVINNNFSSDIDPDNNFLTVEHTTGNLYTDILLTCQLSNGEPTDQPAFDNTTDANSAYVFDELGITSSSGQLLTHVIFNPIQKSLNRLIQINYTVRIATQASSIL